MAVVWSWAFGNETKTDLESFMAFQFPVGGGTQAPQTGTGDVYTYAAFPGTKYSWGTSSNRLLIAPTINLGAGRVAVAVKAQTDWYGGTGAPLLQVTGIADPNDMVAYMYVSNASTGAISCYVDNTFAGTTSVTVSNWHYLCISFDFGVTTPNSATATFFVDGTQVATGTDSSGPTGTETQVQIKNGGFAGYGNLALTAQIIAYSDATSEADAATPKFVSRLAPNADTSTTGTWTPSSGATNVGVTAGTYDNAEYTLETTPSSGDQVITEVNNLATQLGVTPGIVAGATNHTYSSGTNLQAFASVKDSTGVFVDGATVTPDQADTTYAYATTTAVTGSSIINVKYEVV